MRLSDFIDFISVKRGREDRRRQLSTVAHDDAFLYHSYRPVTEARLLIALSANVGGRNRINLRIRGSAYPQINKC